MAATLVVARSRHDVPTTVQRLPAALDRRGIRLFAVIDHGAGAAEAGLELSDEVVLVFGAPRVGTLLMQADPRAGLDLPLRTLVWSQDGETHVAYRDPRALAGDFALTGRSDTLDQLHGLLEQLVREVTT